MPNVRIEVRQAGQKHVQVWDLDIDERELELMIPEARKCFIASKVQSFVEEKHKLDVRWEEEIEICGHIVHAKNLNFSEKCRLPKDHEGCHKGGSSEWAR
jgi:hypothetical protein